MNNARRKTLGEAMDLLYRAKDILECVRDEETEAFENIPENLEGSDRYERAEEIVGYLDEAFDGLEEMLENLEEVIS